MSLLQSILNSVRRTDTSAATKRRHRRLPKVETLENRLVLSISASEQLFAYLLNRARSDPVAYQNEHSLSVDLSSVPARPPLAVNDSLFSSSGFKAEEMATYNYLAHTSPYTGYPNKLTRTHGYDLDSSLSDSANNVESLAGGLATASDALRTLIVDAGVPSLGHRRHLMGIDTFHSEHREIGVGYGFNNSATYRHYWAIHATRSDPADQFLTGVVYSDSNGNQRYDKNEGMGGVTVHADSFSTTTNAEGGWSIAVPDGEYMVSASGGSFSGVSSAPVTVSGDSVEVDFISGANSGYVNFDLWVNTAPTLDTSGSPTLPPVLENDNNPPAAVVAGLIGNSVTDPDPKAIEGIAVTGLTGSASGTWKYALHGSNSWSNFGSVSTTSARLLRDIDSVRFVPNTGFVGSATITFQAWDQTSGSAGGATNLSGGTGGSTAFSSASQSATITVIAANTAPLLNVAANPSLTSIAEDSTDPAGNTVNEIAASAIIDPDPGAAVGVAVVGVAATSDGTWQYSLDSGGSWTDMGAVASDSARLLRGVDRVRFVPQTNFNGSATFAFHAWDQMSGTAGGLADLASAGSTGGETSFSTASDSAMIFVTAVNDAPLLVDPGDLKLSPVPPNLSFPSGQTVASFLENASTDIDAGASRGVAIIGSSGSGTFWFNTSGGWWSGTMSPNFAVLLNANDQIGFTPASGSTASGSIAFRAWDQTTGPEISGRWADLSSPSRVGGTTAYSSGTATASVAVGETARPTVLSIVRLNPSPSSATSVSFRATFSENVERVTVDDFVPTTTGSVLASVESVSGSDAVYTITVDSISGTGNLALAFDSSNQNIRDLIGNRLNLSGFGGSEVYTVASNSAPVLDSSGNPTLTAVDEDATNPSGNTVASVVGTSITDADAGALEGVAIVGLTGTGSGDWQFSTNNGSTWSAIETVSTNSARLLRDTDKLRFVPNSDVNGFATVAYHAWDQTSGLAGGLGDASMTGGSTAFSTASDVARILMNPLNDAPVLDNSGDPTLTTILVNTANPPGDTVASIVGTSITDVDFDAGEGVAVIGVTGAASGTWQYSTSNGSTWTALGGVSATSARLLWSMDKLRFVPNTGFVGTATVTYRAWDLTSGSRGGTGNASTNGGQTAFSTASETASISVQAGDFGDAPAPYPVTMVQDGARHIAVGPSLGLSRDVEADGNPTAAADGDGIDEDGVMFGSIYAGNTMAGVNINLQNATEARVDAWLDFDDNGTWDASDQILDNSQVFTGLQTLNFPIPLAAVVDHTFARVRISTIGNLEPTGVAADGEVEDYHVEILAAAPSVLNVTINDEDPQRASVTELVVTFDRQVSAPAIAFAIKDHDTNEIVDSLIVNLSEVDGRTVSRLTFDPGTQVIGGGLNSLVDGNYLLEITAAQIVAAGNGTSMASDFRFGELSEDAFFRKYGDFNGNGVVDLLDFAEFRRTFGKSAGQSGYLGAFDSEGDNSIGLLDFAAFRRNFGT